MRRFSDGSELGKGFATTESQGSCPISSGPSTNSWVNGNEQLSRMRPQANGAAVRTEQMITKAIKRYIADFDQRDWDEYAERLKY
ncbi:reverse transcriptase [Phytophthora megakarya]|uniref:Reverse transcriptase n=1 Tax=Phytophthora megakarya TaxID=4795 RepID=A0A225W8A9_9STRA|nr:reverse transcriptase [Phytophthora megakarya]